MLYFNSFLSISPSQIISQSSQLSLLLYREMSCFIWILVLAYASSKQLLIKDGK